LKTVRAVLVPLRIRRGPCVTRLRLGPFHFHAHREHAIDSESFPLELHLVHSNQAAQLAVVGIPIAEGAENAALASVFSNLPKTSGPAHVIEGASVEAADFWPASS
jgi:carbonic anhydrase